MSDLGPYGPLVIDSYCIDHIFPDAKVCLVSADTGDDVARELRAKRKRLLPDVCTTVSLGIPQ